MKDRRVVITGLGVVCPVGMGIGPAYEALLAGQHGVRRIEVSRRATQKPDINEGKSYETLTVTFLDDDENEHSFTAFPLECPVSDIDTVGLIDKDRD